MCVERGKCETVVGGTSTMLGMVHCAKRKPEMMAFNFRKTSLEQIRADGPVSIAAPLPRFRTARDSGGSLIGVNVVL